MTTKGSDTSSRSGGVDQTTTPNVRRRGHATARPISPRDARFDHHSRSAGTKGRCARAAHAHPSMRSRWLARRTRPVWWVFTSLSCGVGAGGGFRGFGRTGWGIGRWTPAWRGQKWVQNRRKCLTTRPNARKWGRNHPRRKPGSERRLPSAVRSGVLRPGVVADPAAQRQRASRASSARARASGR